MTHKLTKSPDSESPKHFRWTSQEAGLWNAAKMAAVTCPVLIIHGEQDELLPVRNGQALHDASVQAASREIVRIAGAGHNDILGFEAEYFGALRGFLASVGRVSGGPGAARL